MWQIELIDQVTWCSTATRTSPAQKNAVSAPHQDIVIRPPITAGASRRDNGPEREQPADPDDVAVGEQVGGEPG